MDILTANDVPGAYPDSWYAASAGEPPTIASTEGDGRFDVAVVGAGFTGLSTALHLAEAGRSVVVLDAHRVGWGASGRNGGQVGSGMRCDQDDLEAWLGVEHARALWDIGEAAKQRVQALIQDHGIACDYTPGIYYTQLRADGVPAVHAYVDKLRKDYRYDTVETVEPTASHTWVDSPRYAGGYVDWGAGHLHPLKFAFGLARAALAAGVTVRERTRVQSIDRRDGGVRVRTATGTVQARHLVLACNGYLGELDRRVSARVMPINNFIAATEPLSDADAAALINRRVAVADSKFVINYFRLSADNRLLFGGGENYSYRFPADIAAFVRRPMREIFPQLEDRRIDYAWGGTLGITVRRMPYFACRDDTVYTAGGYSGHGVALATLSGQLIADAIGGDAERFNALARVPSLPFPGGSRLRWPLLVAAMTWYSLRDRVATWGGRA
ncbi:MAG: FAD-binding oxidoreductase [Pseudomonadota bacterium]